MHRIQFQSHLPKYLNNDHNYKELIHLRKIFSYVKVSDLRLCSNYWNLSLKMLDEDLDANIILKLCQNYVNFNTDINNYRHYKFEAKIIDFIKDSLKTDISLNPGKISGYLSFVMLYGKSKDRNILKVLLDKFEEDFSRVKAIDCLKMSRSISLLSSGKSCCMSPTQIQKIKALLNESTKYQLEINKDDYLQNSTLLKAYILRDDSDIEILRRLFMRYREMDVMSSKIVESISYICMATRSLIPELIDNCVEYVVRYKDNILGFNAEKILFLCFYLGYHPKDDKFFEIVINVIIR